MQGLDRIERRCTSRRQKPERDADGGTDADARDCGPGGERHVPPERHSKHCGGESAETHSRDAT